MNNITIREMIKETIDKLSGKATYEEIKKNIRSKWGDINLGTIADHLQVLTN